MRRRQLALIALAALAAGGLGLLASVAVYGPTPLLDSTIGRQVLRPVLERLGQSPVDETAIGATIAPIRLPDLSGRLHRLPVPGRPMLINYWASWCGPCRDEMPLLSQLAASQDATAVLGIALDSAEDAAAFLEDRPVGFAVRIEPPGPSDSSVRLGNRRGVLPFTVLIGPDGRLLKRHYGAFRSTAELQEWISGAE